MASKEENRVSIIDRAGIQDSLPWDELASLLPREDRGPGATKWFDAKGMFALMFLKAYLNACPGLSGQVHMLQVDGLSFLDAMCFKNFHETTRLKLSVLKHKAVFGRTSQLGADRIYASNANRRYCTGNKIFTCFAKKGPKKHSRAEQILRSEIARQRATVMEGVLATHKDHYGLRKIKVKGEKREKLMVLFAPMAANAVKIAKRKQERPPPADRAA